MPPSSSVLSMLLPSATPSHTPALVPLASDSNSIPASMAPSFSLIPSAFPTLAHTDSLACSDAEISSILPLFSIMPMSTMPLISSNFEYLPSAMVDQPACTLLSMPSSSLTSSMSLPSVTEEQPKPEPEPIPSITPASTPPSLSTFLPSPVSMRSVINSQPKPESVSMPPIIPSSPALLSAPLLALPITDDDPEFESAPFPLSLTMPMDLECSLSPVRTAMDNWPKHKPMSSTTLTSPVLPHTPSLAPSFTDDVPELFPTLPALQSASLARSEVPTSLSSLTKPSPSKSPTSVPACSLPPLHPLLGELCCNLMLESLATPATSYSLESPPSSLGELIPLLPVQHEASVVVPTPRHSTPSQRPPGLKTFNSDSSTLEITPQSPPLASSVPQQSQELSLVYGTSPPLPLSRFGLTHNFALAIVITTAFVSTLINLLKTLPTHLRKFWSKNQDTSNSQNGIPKACNIPTQRLQLGQFMPHTARFIFDPGGQASSSRLLSRHTTMLTSAC
ncbi:hypothetical protein EDB89DRAFT_2158406 [Lactarius sanguifluus]|nr:hypothetical protein EDB89DRAFT_2158406 [Lactarius sanguifluus]